MSLRPSPNLVVATALLALSAGELAEEVEREVARCPALELVERRGCAICGQSLSGARCAQCDRRQLSAASATSFDPAASAPAEPTLTERLMTEIGPQLTQLERPVAEYLLGSIDARGRLVAEPDEVATTLGVTLAAVERVHAEIQAAGPPGFAARSLRECLLLQIGRYGGVHGAVAYRIVADYLDDLGAGRYGKIARALGISRDDVLAARDFVAARLTPHPGGGESTSRPAAPVVADVVALDTGSGLVVQVLEPERFRLTISPSFERALSSPLSALQREAIGQQVRAAREFITRLEQRWRTMRAVAEVAVEHQSAFVRGGRPVVLTRAAVAAELGLHESTVSRAVSGRHLLLPSGRIVPFARLFLRTDAPLQALADLVAGETVPKSDAQLARLLGDGGFLVSRRTVSKYRRQLGIRHSSERRPAKTSSA
jgi:RNA polymerase sigma-54 factor